MSIYELTKGQSKIWVEKYLNPFMQENDFKLKKTRNSDLDYFKKTDYGYSQLNLGFLNSWPGTQISYGFYIRFNQIEEICQNILTQLNTEYKINNLSHSIATSQGSFDKIHSNSFMPEMVTEEDVKQSCDLVINFLEKTGFPLAQRFSDIKELDKEINGDNFWKSDWQMPFTLGGDFNIKRLIIAKLANEGNFEKMFQFHVDELNKIRLEKGIEPAPRCFHHRRGVFRVLVEYW
ncbi:hypothetical protein MCERE19_01628 [Spirosomataceae bacterium]